MHTHDELGFVEDVHYKRSPKSGNGHKESRKKKAEHPGGGEIDFEAHRKSLPDNVEHSSGAEEDAPKKTEGSELGDVMEAVTQAETLISNLSELKDSLESEERRAAGNDSKGAEVDLPGSPKEITLDASEVNPEELTYKGLMDLLIVHPERANEVKAEAVRRKLISISNEGKVSETNQSGSKKLTSFLREINRQGKITSYKAEMPTSFEAKEGGSKSESVTSEEESEEVVNPGYTTIQGEPLNKAEEVKRAPSETEALEAVRAELMKEDSTSPEEKLLKIGRIESVTELLKLIPSEKRAKEVLDAIKLTDFVITEGKVVTRRFHKPEGYDYSAEEEYIESETGRELFESLREEIKAELIEIIRQKEHEALSTVSEKAIAGSDLGKKLRAELSEQRAVPAPPKMGFASRLYLSIFEGSKYQLQKEREKAHKDAQIRIKEFERFEKTWSKKEYRLAEAAAESRIETLLYLSEVQAGKEVPPKELERIMAGAAKVYGMRMSINDHLQTKSMEKIGITGEPPKVDEWQGLKEDASFVEIANNAGGEIAKGLRKRVDEEFIKEKWNEYLGPLASLMAREKMLEEKLAMVSKTGSGTENQAYQILLELSSIKEARKKAESGIEVQLRWHENTKKLQTFGQKIKAALKKEFGKTLMGVDPEFEIKYDTALAKIVTNGQSQIAHGLSTAKEAELMGKQAFNRSKKGIVNLRKSVNERLRKIIPESDRIAEKLTVLEEKSASLDEQNRQIKEALSFILSEKSNAWERVVTQKEKFKKGVMKEVITLVSRSDNENQKLTEYYETNGLTEKLLEKIKTAGEMKIYNNRVKQRTIKGEIKEAEAEITRLEHLADSTANKAYREIALQELAELMEQRAELARALKTEKEREEMIMEKLMLEVGKLREASEKHLAKKLAESFRAVA